MNCANLIKNGFFLDYCGTFPSANTELKLQQQDMLQGNISVGLSALNGLCAQIPSASAVAGGYGGQGAGLPRRNEMKPGLTARLHWANCLRGFQPLLPFQGRSIALLCKYLLSGQIGNNDKNCLQILPFQGRLTAVVEAFSWQLSVGLTALCFLYIPIPSAARDLQPACTGLTAYGAFSPFCPFRADYFCRAYSLNGLYDLIPSAARSTGSLAKLFTEHYNTVKCPEGERSPGYSMSLNMEG